MRGDVVRFGDPGGPDARRGRASQRTHPLMRKREAEAATTQMGRMGAEDPTAIPQWAPKEPTEGKSQPRRRRPPTFWTRSRS